MTFLGSVNNHGSQLRTVECTLVVQRKAVTPLWGHFRYNSMSCPGARMLNILHNAELFHLRHQEKSPLRACKLCSPIGHSGRFRALQSPFWRSSYFYIWTSLYKWSPEVQWTIRASRGGNVCIFPSLTPRLHIVFMEPHKHRILMDLMRCRNSGCHKVITRQAYYIYGWFSGLFQEATLSIWTRTCFRCKKKAMAS